MHRNRAFTLIELLVVIAIIAILAAILFPVFAQAKVAAKGAASISNDKQIVTASMIYMGDYDDMPPPVGIIGEPDSPFLLNGTLYKPWSWLMLPYMKAGIIYQDPLRMVEPTIPGAPDDALWSYRTHFGYAYTTFSPTLFTSGRWVVSPTVHTSLGDPSNTVMFLSKKGRDATLDWLWVGSPIWMANLVAPTHCGATYTDPIVKPQSICPPAVRWGIDGYASGQKPTEIEGAYTGGMAIRKAGRAIVANADGHVKSMAPAQVASGTNWTKNTPSASIRITDITQYRWDME